MPDGSERIIVFRAATPPPPPKPGRRRSGHGDVDGRLGQRSAAGLVGIFYQGELVQSIRALDEHVQNEFGPGRYRVVVQRILGGSWTYRMSTVRAIGEETIPPEPDEGPDDDPDDEAAMAREKAEKAAEGLTGGAP